VTKSGGATLLDFGLAKGEASSVLDAEADARSDIFSFGVVLHEIVDREARVRRDHARQRHRGHPPWPVEHVDHVAEIERSTDPGHERARPNGDPGGGEAVCSCVEWALALAMIADGRLIMPAHARRDVQDLAVRLSYDDCRVVSQGHGESTLVHRAVMAPTEQHEIV
jgi:hypothetical protein